LSAFHVNAVLSAFFQKTKRIEVEQPPAVGRFYKRDRIFDNLCMEVDDDGEGEVLVFQACECDNRKLLPFARGELGDFVGPQDIS